MTKLGTLEERCRELLAGIPGVDERRMFGGLAFMVGGNMLACAYKGNLIVRLDKGEAYDRALKRTHVRPMDITGRPMRGFVIVEPAGLTRANSLRTWLETGLAFAETLPPKKGKKRGQ